MKLHKNSDENNKHTPKGFTPAAQLTNLTKDELNESTYVTSPIYPSALEFVDASAVPPSTNEGDVYVLATGGSVNAAWGSASLKDWVKYRNGAWTPISPAFGTHCYDKTGKITYSFDNTDWVQVGGGDSIYTASGTAFTDVEVTIDNTITFKGGEFIIEGENTLSTSTALGIYDGDTTPSLLWDWRNDGKLLYKSGTSLVIGNTLGTISNHPAIIAIGSGNSVTGDASKVIGNNNTVSGLGNAILGGAISSTQDFTVALGTWLSSTATGASIIGYGVSGSSVLVNNTANSIAFGWNQTTPQHLLSSDGVEFKGANTLSTSSVLELYDGDTTPSLMWDWRNNGDLHLNQDTTIDYSGGTDTLTFNGHNGGAVTTAFNGRTAIISNTATSSNNVFEIQNQAGTRIFEVRQGSTIVNSCNIQQGINSTWDLGVYDLTIDGTDAASEFTYQGNTGGGITASWEGRTAFKSNTATAAANVLEVQNQAGTRIFEVRQGGSILTNGNAGFTGTGSYTNFTIENGIITNAS